MARSPKSCARCAAHIYEGSGYVCLKCGAWYCQCIVMEESGRCHCGGSLQSTRGARIIRVEGENSQDVERVTSSLMKRQRESASHKNPWSTGSFYLFAVLVLVIAGLAAGRLLPVIVLPFVLIFGLLAVVFVGALQLRHDDRLSERGFSALMLQSLKSLPLLKRGKA